MKSSPQITQRSIAEGDLKGYGYCKVWDIETGLEEMLYEYVDWMQLTQYKFHRRTSAIVIICLWVPRAVGSTWPAERHKHQKKEYAAWSSYNGRQTLEACVHNSMEM
jgi:thiaminase